MIRRIRALLGAYFGLRLPCPLGHFALGRIRNQALTLDFDNRKSFEPHYSAFKVSEVSLGCFTVFQKNLVLQICDYGRCLFWLPSFVSCLPIDGPDYGNIRSSRK